MSTYSGGGTTNMVAASPYTASEIAEKRHILSEEESENLFKSLHVLAGRTEELRERLAGVLKPSSPNATAGSAQALVQPTGSPLTDKFRNMRGVAEAASGIIDDILLRLDV